MADFLQGASSGKIFISVIIASNQVFLVTMFKNICLVSPICQQMSIQTQSLSHPQTFPEFIMYSFLQFCVTKSSHTQREMNDI